MKDYGSPKHVASAREKKCKRVQTSKWRQAFPRLLFVLSSGAMCLSCIQNLLTFFGFFPRLSFGLFKNGIDKIYRTHRVNITPSMAFHTTVSMCGALQAIWTTHTVFSVFRRVPTGAAILNPPVLSSSFFVLYSLGTISNIVWPFLFDRVLLFESAIMESLVAVFLFPAFCSAAFRFYYFRETLSKDKRYMDMMVYKWFLLNGVAMQWTYALLSMVLNVTIVASLTLSSPPSVELSSNIGLGMLSLLMLVYTVVDITVMRPVFRGVASPYLVVMWYLADILIKNWNPANPSTIVSIALMASTFLSLVLKTVVSLYNGKGPKPKWKSFEGLEKRSESVI